ncbi:AzlC family ABC transporter permease [Brevibacillus borstelensis]|uniref:AzlC family ABC transporter permease n=1 Tax=Brevibacillus borstelensis TaxID=45462 RepID=UPI001D09D92A|nr:AzlC family ABC transporter permease [Brevibacillus borstelensis]MCC0565256.1 AzlC family ABC transporter permease [Brevibacillus borstelensis]MCM3592098.1 AzlC family ABC transporter permease [Brevibacillus borstelensis]
MKNASPSTSSWKEGLIDSLPITASYIIYGAIFGMLAGQAGLTSWESIAMSVLVYSGASQFAGSSLIAEQASVWAIILTTCLLNLRHFLMGLSISPHYQRFSTAQVNGLAFFLTDEQYALTLNRFRHRESDVPYILSVSVALYTGWCGGTWIGTAAGAWIPDPASLGLGFSFTAMFLALAYYQLSSLLRIFAFLLCGAASVFLSFVVPNGLPVLIAGCLAFAIGYFWPTQEDGDQTAAEETRGAESA